MRATTRLIALVLLTSLGGCATHYAILTVPVDRDSWNSLRQATAEVASQFGMREQGYPGMGDRPDTDGWHALAYYIHPEHPECDHQNIHVILDADPVQSRARLSISNFLNGSETPCAVLIRQAIVTHYSAAGLGDVQVVHKTVRAVPP